MAISKVGSRPIDVDVPEYKPPPPPPPKVEERQPINDASSFDRPKRDPLCLNPSEGRGHGTNDDSVGRGHGTNDDSVGRGNGTNDDSIGRGTNDDSIGTGGNGARDVSGENPDWSAKLRESINQTGLSPAAQEKISAVLADPEKSRAAAYALKSEAFSNLSADQREKFVDVLAKGDDIGAKLMARMCERGGDIFNEKAIDGSTTLDNLSRLANAPNSSTFLNHALADIAHPGRIWQGNAPTCTASTMQYELAKEKPAEYARLLTGLAVDGSVKMAGGGTLVSQTGNALYSSFLSHDQRSPTEAVFQSALMEYANGSDSYNVFDRRSTKADGSTYRGLYGEQIRNSVEQLFGVEYETTKISSNAEAQRALMQLNRDERPNRPVLIDLVVDDKSNHCVAFEGFRNGRVYFRDPATGKLDSITQQQFLDTAAAVHFAPPPEIETIRADKLNRRVIE